MTKEEAVEILMNARGYQQWDRLSLWYKADANSLTKEEALAECLDLNVLAEIWAKNKWEVRIRYKLETVCSLYNWDEEHCLLTLLGESKGFPVQEATMFATAEALKVREEK